MTDLSTLGLVPGFLGLALSVFLLYRTELRRADISLRLLAPAVSWTVTIARRGSPVQAPEPAEADYLSMYGIFPVAATNDGPRGGAIWGLRAEVDGFPDSWRFRFNPNVTQPYALAGRSCEGWNHVALMLDCDFDQLGDGLRHLKQGGQVVFRLGYCRQNWRGHATRKTTTLKVSRADLLAGLRNGARSVDLSLSDRASRGPARGGALR